MRITISISGLKQSRWYEFGLRFLFGGLVTAIAGLIAKEYGAGIGGLFLAFPAIFPASATLIEKHEREKKQKHGLNGTKRARALVADDSAGAALGALGLASFAVCTWLLMPNHSVALVLVVSAAAWAGVSLSAWSIWKRL
ncbi:MAG TPA: DUF3147 family protein [Candidatus Limnocylindrales bacterium]|nr:DUF3147 family protein [Candidatus Limnocylindrales bacterium]